MKKLSKYCVTGIDLLIMISDGEFLPDELICKDKIYYLKPCFINNTSYFDGNTDIDMLYEDLIGNNLKLSNLSNFTNLYWYYESILDDEEKRYLSNIIKPFRSRVKYITKNKINDKLSYISIDFYEPHGKRIEYICLPNFKTNTMYKNMELGNDYTFEELGL